MSRFVSVLVKLRPVFCTCRINSVSNFTLFVTAVRVLLLIKLRWPKKQSIYECTYRISRWSFNLPNRSRRSFGILRANLQTENAWFSVLLLVELFQMSDDSKSQNLIKIIAISSRIWRKKLSKLYVWFSAAHRSYPWSRIMQKPFKHYFTWCTYRVWGLRLIWIDCFKLYGSQP